MKRLLITVIVLSVCIFNLSAEEKRQDESPFKFPSIEGMEISPNPVGRGDLFTITITVDYDNSEDVEFLFDAMPAELVLWRGPYVRSFTETDKSGASVRKTRITTTFKAQASGRMIIPPLTVNAGKFELNTDPVLLRVGLYSNRKLYMPIEVEWQAGLDTVFVGEAVPVFLTVKNQEVVVIFDQTKIAYPRDGFFEQASGIGQITTLKEGKVVLYDIPAETFIYTAHSPGRVKVPSSGVEYGGITGWSNDFYLTVQPAPAEIKESGAIGDFSLSSKLDKTQVEAGKYFELEITVKGSGNLNYLELPEPSAAGCILISTEESKSYSPSLSGFSGTKSMKWIYESEEIGTAEISVPEFEFFSRTTGKVESVRERNYRVNITAAEAVEAVEEPVIFPFSKLPESDTETAVWKNYYHDYYRYVWLLPALLFFILIKILRGKKIPVAIVLTVIIFIAVVSVGRFSFNFEAESVQDSIPAGKLYNEAIDSFHEDRLTDCLHELRTAVYLDPVNNLYRETLSWIEQDKGYINSISPAIQLHPDIFYYIIIISFNLFFLAAAVASLRSGGGLSVMIILFGFTVILAGGMMVYSHLSRQEMTAVISGTDRSLKKIPRESAENWVPLKAGTAVRILNRSDDFILVETGLGVKGWINDEFILPDRSAQSEDG